MTSTRAINAAAGVIHAAMQQGKTLPIAYAYALDAACLVNSPELAAELVSLRSEVVDLRARVAELEAQAPYREVWSSELPPGGLVCSVCGQPVESEPCPDHAPQGTDALTPEALHASSGAVIELPARPEDVSRQVQQLRGLLAGQREDAYRSPLHHDYRTPHDLPEPGVRP